jgi:hypothetical protein
MSGQSKSQFLRSTSKGNNMMFFRYTFNFFCNWLAILMLAVLYPFAVLFNYQHAELDRNVLPEMLKEVFFR